MTQPKEWILSDLASIRTVLCAIEGQRRSLTALCKKAKLRSDGVVAFAHDTRKPPAKDIHMTPVLAVLDAAGYEVVVRPKKATSRRELLIAAALAEAELRLNGAKETI